MNFGEKLKDLRREKNLTQQTLGQLIGVSTVTVRSWENNSRSPGMEQLMRISRALNTSIDSLLEVNFDRDDDDLSREERSLLSQYRILDVYGKQAVDSICSIEYDRMTSQQKQRHREEKVVDFQENATAQIPYFYLPSAAGTSAPLDDNNFKMITISGYVPPETDFAIHVQGNSMFPYIEDGEMVFVKKQEELNIGDVGIFCVDGALYCKQYYRTWNGTVTLVSANPALKDTNVVLTPESGSSLSVCGKVLLGRRIDLPKYLFEK